MGSMGATLLISSIGMTTPVGTTHLIYGRYTDNLIPAVVAYGVLSLFSVTLKKEIKHYIFFLVNIIVSGELVNYYMRLTDVKGVAYINNIGMAKFVSSEKIETSIASLFTILVIIILLLFVKKYGCSYKGVIFLCIMTGLLWMYEAEYGLQNFESPSGSWRTSIEEAIICSSIMEQPENSQAEIYAISGENGFPYTFSGNAVQFLMKEKQIKYIEAEAADKLTENSIIIIPKNMNISFGNILYSGKVYILIQTE